MIFSTYIYLMQTDFLVTTLLHVHGGTPSRIGHTKLGKVLVNRHKVQFGSIINLVKGGHDAQMSHLSAKPIYIVGNRRSSSSSGLPRGTFCVMRFSLKFHVTLN